MQNINEQKTILYKQINDSLAMLRSGLLANSNEKHILREVSDLIDSAMQAAGLKPVEE